MNSVAYYKIYITYININIITHINIIHNFQAKHGGDKDNRMGGVIPLNRMESKYILRSFNTCPIQKKLQETQLRLYEKKNPITWSKEY